MAVKGTWRVEHCTWNRGIKGKWARRARRKEGKRGRGEEGRGGRLGIGQERDKRESSTNYDLP